VKRGRRKGAWSGFLGARRRCTGKTGGKKGKPKRVLPVGLVETGECAKQGAPPPIGGRVIRRGHGRARCFPGSRGDAKKGGRYWVFQGSRRGTPTLSAEKMGGWGATVFETRDVRCGLPPPEIPPGGQGARFRGRLCGQAGLRRDFVSRLAHGDPWGIPGLSDKGGAPGAKLAGGGGRRGVEELVEGPPPSTKTR